MGIYSNFPYSDFENLNLDWIIKIVKELQHNFADLSIEVQQAIAKIDAELAELDIAFNEKLEEFDETFNQWLIDKEPEIALIVNTYINQNLSDFIAHAQYIENNETLKIGDGESGQVLTPTVDITDDIVQDTSVDYTEAQTKNGFVIIRFMTERKTYAVNDILYTIPSAYRPISSKNSLYYTLTLFDVGNNIDTSAQFLLSKTNGTLKISNIDTTQYDSTKAVRIYGTIIYPYL